MTEAERAGTEYAPFFPMGARTPGRGPALSIVIPMCNEAGAAGSLVREIAAALEGVSHEIIVVDDASSDGTAAVLGAVAKDIPALRILVHGRNAGQSRALRTGVLAARAPVIVTLDGDGQNDPADIPALYAALVRESAPSSLAMVAGERRDRHDAASRKTASRLANLVRSKLLKDGAADTGCGLKAFLREAFLRLPYFDHCHRYLPALMRREGFAVEFAPVSHRPRVHGRSKYTNLGRLAVAIRDLLGVVWLIDRFCPSLDICEVQTDPSCDKMEEKNKPRGAKEESGE